MKTAESKHIKAFIEGTREDGIIDRHRSEALNAINWAEETENLSGSLHIRIKKIAEGFTVNTGIEIPPYVKPGKVSE